MKKEIVFDGSVLAENDLHEMVAEMNDVEAHWVMNPFTLASLVRGDYDVWTLRGEVSVLLERPVYIDASMDNLGEGLSVRLVDSRFLESTLLADYGSTN